MVAGGIRGGQVIGRTDAEAATVTDRPVGTLDFMATVCRALGIDHNKQNHHPNGRPIRIVDRPATPIAQLF
jgi:arylsulfatase A-like enzyme